MTEEEAVDLCAGPGGWDSAARKLGINVLGIELDDSAVATRKAAGLRTLQADVSALEPIREFEGGGIIASPPCQAFSTAGQGHGTRALPAYEEAIERWLDGDPPSREELDKACDDERAHIVLEPLRWTLALRPMWLVCEQVEPVLPLWEAMARGLRKIGYSAWTGVLRAEQYGVPQTRKRAILIARRDGVEARQPPPTHRRYIAPGAKAKAKQEDSLFAAPEPEHRIERGEEELLPWISMAEALGWLPESEVGFPRRNDVEGDDGEYRERDLRSASEPAFALTEKARSWTRFRANARSKATQRNVDEPAPTITAGHDYAERHWTAERPAPTIVTTRKSKDGMIVGRQLPAGEGEHVGGKDWDAGAGHRREDVEDDAQKNAVRVTAQEAAMLQSFPADYPWQGTRSKRFEQIGNAIPPLLAEAILREFV